MASTTMTTAAEVAWVTASDPFHAPFLGREDVAKENGVSNRKASSATSSERKVLDVHKPIYAEVFIPGEKLKLFLSHLIEKANEMKIRGDARAQAGGILVSAHANSGEAFHKFRIAAIPNNARAKLVRMKNESGDDFALAPVDFGLIGAKGLVGQLWVVPFTVLAAFVYILYASVSGALGSRTAPIDVFGLTTLDGSPAALLTAFVAVTVALTTSWYALWVLPEQAHYRAAVGEN